MTIGILALATFAACHRNRPSDQDHSDVCLYQLGSHGVGCPRSSANRCSNSKSRPTKASLTKAILECPPSLRVQHGMRTGVQDTDALQLLACCAGAVSGQLVVAKASPAMASRLLIRLPRRRAAEDAAALRGEALWQP